jgi:hypothetical protein
MLVRANQSSFHPDWDIEPGAERRSNGGTVNGMTARIATRRWGILLHLLFVVSINIHKTTNHQILGIMNFLGRVNHHMCLERITVGFHNSNLMKT